MADQMSFEDWLRELEAQPVIMVLYPRDRSLVDVTGEACWREMFDDGLTPEEAAEAERDAVMS